MHNILFWMQKIANILNLVESKLDLLHSLIKETQTEIKNEKEGQIEKEKHNQSVKEENEKNYLDDLAIIVEGVIKRHTNGVHKHLDEIEIRLHRHLDLSLTRLETQFTALFSPSPTP